MDSATEKLELGLARLAKAGDDTDMLGLALQSIHGALEDAFRAQLAADSQIGASQRAAFADPKQVQWKDLLDAMQLHRDLSAPDRELIWRTNALRTKVAHGGRYTGARAELEHYAALVQRLSGYTPKPSRVAEKPSRRTAEKPAAPRRPAAAIADIPRAKRSAPPVPQRSGWPGGVLALVLLGGLALFVALRLSAQSQPRAAAAPTEAATAAPASGAQDIALVPTMTPTPLRSATVNAQEGINLRQDHKHTATALLALPSGTRVTIVSGPVADDGYTWWNVEFNGRRGWCAGEFLTFDTT